jgi:hypothetical protein
MNWFVRNFVVVACGAATSLLTVGYLLFLQASDGDVFLSHTGLGLAHFHILSFIPVGSIFAGFAGALGYLAVALVLRVRPANIVLVSMLAISLAMVYVAQSAEMALWMAPVTVADSATSFSKFLLHSTVHSQVRYWSTGDDSSSSSTSASSSSTASPASISNLSSNTGNASSDEITSGLNGLIDSQNAGNSAAAHNLTKMDANVQNVGAGVMIHGSQWIAALLRALGFAIGALVVFFHLRSIPYCGDCMLLLSPKGVKTRYYVRWPEMRNSVDEVMSKARERLLRESIQAHLSRGSDEKTKWAEYFSTLEISRCRQCAAHRLHYRTFRKQGSNWQDIALMGFTATTIEPLDFA